MEKMSSLMRDNKNTLSLICKNEIVIATDALKIWMHAVDQYYTGSIISSYLASRNALFSWLVVVAK